MVKASMESSERSAFPSDRQSFDADPRVSFSKLNGKFILEADDGQEYEYDGALKRWLPVLDESLLERQSRAYAVAGVDESEPAVLPKKKRKQAHVNGEDEEGGRVVQPKRTKPSAEPRERKNTAIYVSNLPPDARVDEVERVFARCGVIAEEIDRGRPRIKMYADDQGNFKGDALILYFRPESVDIAIQMLDESDFRLGVSAPNGKMKVVAADFSYKTQKEAPAKGSAKDKKRIIKKTQKLNNKLADWDDDDGWTLPESGSKWDKVVILKHMFTLAELQEDPAAILDIKEDIRDECAKLGDVTNVVLFDKEADGVASVRFAHPDAARACVKVLHGRSFAGAQVVAFIADGSEKFAKSGDRATALGLDEPDRPPSTKEDESERLARFGSWLEEGATDVAGAGERRGAGDGMAS